MDFGKLSDEELLDQARRMGVVPPTAGAVPVNPSGAGAPVPAGGTTVSGRPTYRDQSGGVYSEKTVTFPLDNKWVTFPSVDAKGNIMSEDQVADYVRQNGPVDPITGERFPMFNTMDDAVSYAQKRSATRLPSSASDMSDEQLIERARQLGIDVQPATPQPTDVPADAPQPSLWGNVVPDMMAQGGTFGASDEMEASVKSGSIAGFTPNLWGDYDQELDETRSRMQAGREAHPVASTVAEIGGLIASPGALLMKGAGKGASLVQRGIQAAKAGGIGGGLYGFFSGEGTEDRAMGAAVGAGTGAAVGFATPYAVEGAKKVGQGIVSAKNKVTGSGRALLNPEAEANRRLGFIAKEAEAGGHKIMSPGSTSAAQMRGQPVRNVDRLGVPAQRELRAATNMSREAEQKVAPFIDDRYKGQSTRARSLFHRLSDGADSAETRVKLRQQYRKEAAPLYRKAHRQGYHIKPSPEMERLMGSPDVVDAMRTVANKTGKNRAIADGYGGFNSPVSVLDDGRIVFAKRNAGGPRAASDIQFWDYVKQELDDKVGRLYTQGAKGEADALSSIRNSLRNELDNLVPSYKAARGRAAEFFGADDALEMGRKFLKKGTQLREARPIIEDMTKSQRKLFMEGVATELDEMLLNVGKGRDIVKVLDDIPAVKAKIKMAFGPQKARQVEAFFLVERAMQQTKEALGNSWTAKNLADLGLGAGLSGAYSYGVGDYDPGSFTTRAAMIYGLRRAMRGGNAAMNRRVAEKIVDKLMSSDPTVVDAAVKSIAKNGRLLGAMRKLDIPAALAAGAQASRVTAP